MSSYGGNVLISVLLKKINYLNIFLKFPGVCQSFVPSSAIRNKPRDFSCLIHSVVPLLRQLLNARVIIGPSLVGGYYIAVMAISSCPIKNFLKFHVTRMIWTLQEVEDPNLEITDI